MDLIDISTNSPTICVERKCIGKTNENFTFDITLFKRLKRRFSFFTSLPIKHHCFFRHNAFVYSVRRLGQFYHLFFLFFFFAVSGLGRRGEIIQEMKPQQSALYNYRGPISTLYSNKI